MKPASHTLGAALLALLLAVSAQAERTALVGGRLIDGFGHAPINDSVILIDGDRVTAVGTVGSLAVPAGYAVLSTEGMDVLPGLWESHAHVMLNGHADYPHWQATYLERQVDEIMPASAVQLLLAGITSARDLGAPLDASMALKAAIENGDIAGPNMEADYGTISKGKKADIIAVRGDVLEHINLLSQVELVMKDGVVYKEGGKPVEANLN